jgi:hypothetical protein
MAIVFQYGSNCLNSEINSPLRLCGDARFLDIAETVEEFELAFDLVRKAQRRGGGHRPQARRQSLGRSL